MSEALQEVICAIETGADWPPTDDLWKRLGLGEGFMVQRAYGGSLDAAQNLHNALLPRWDWERSWSGYVTVTRGTRSFAGTDPSNPARSWLLAILKALRSLPSAEEGKA